jgi:hypothetical protein
MTRARLYLDLDGVINAQMPPWPDTMNGIATAEGHGYKIRWAPALIEEINALDVDLWYATTWRHHAVESFGPLVGLREATGIIHPELDPRAQTTFPSIHWKIPAIIQHQKESPSPFIHIDDEVGDVPGWRENAFDLYGGIALSPPSHLGITQKQIAVVKQYLESLEGDKL